MKDKNHAATNDVSSKPSSTNHARTNDVSSKPSSTNEVRLKAIPYSGWTTGYNYVIDNGVAISMSFVYEYLIDRARDKLVGPANNSRSLKMGYNLFAFRTCPIHLHGQKYILLLLQGSCAPHYEKRQMLHCLMCNLFFNRED